MNHKNKNFIKVLLAALVLVVAGIVYSCSVGKKSEKQSEMVQIAEEEVSEAETESETTQEPLQICVHVCGCVNVPGVYYLDAGSRVHEAVEMAGGMTADADSQYVNLAQEAEDGSQIYIPSRKEVEEGSVPAAESVSQEEADSRININTATVDELKTLPGIGDIKAEAIISYRESAGGFSSPEEIQNVAGIKKNSYEKIKEMIKV